MALEINPTLVTKSNNLTTVDLAAVTNEQVVVGFGGEDTIEIVGGNRIESAAIRGDDVILKINNNNYIRVKNAKGRYLNIIDADGAHYKHYGGEYTYTQRDVIENFMAALDKTSLEGEKALDEAIKACSSKFSTIKEAIAQCVEDCKKADDAMTFLRQYCGIELTDYDTGAITGWDAANPYSKDSEDIVPESGSMKTLSGTSFTANGLKLKIPSKLNKYQQTIVNGLYTWWAKEGLDLITESYGDNFSFTSDVSATVKEMNVEFVNKKQNFLALVRYQYDPKSGKTATLTLQINMYYYNAIAEDNVNGVPSNDSAGYLDRTLAHEFTHAVMAANINHFSKLPNFIVEGMAELTHGIDDHRYSDIVTLAGNPSKLNSNLNVKDTTGSKSTIYAAGYMFLRWLAKQSAIFEKDYVETYDPNNPPVADEETDGVKYSDSKKTKLLIEDFMGVVDASDFNSKLVTLDADKNDQFVALIGNKNANVIRAGSEGASMDGGLGADKLYGGNGADTFSYSVGGGADQIFNYNGSQGDIVQLFGDNSIVAADIKESGKNFILTVGSGKTKGTITFNSPNGRITIVDGDGDTLTTFNEPPPDGITFDSKKTKMTVQAPFEGMIDLDDYAATFKEVDASKNTNAVEIIGNKQSNVIRAGSVGSYMDGGLGADKLYGGDGADTFSYSVGGGADQIYNYNGSQGDIVQLFGDDSIAATDIKEIGKNFVLTVGSGKTKGTITFNNPNGRITIVDGDGDTLTTFNEPPSDGITFDSKKTKLTVQAPFEGMIDLDDYAATFKEVDASKNTNAVEIIGNKQANVIRAGSVGSYMDGGIGADKLYGGDGADTFAYSIGGGADQIYNYNGSQGDIVQLFGDDSIAATDIKESGKNFVLTVGSGKTKGTITFNNPNGRITIVDGDGDTLTTFNEPPSDGITFDSKKTKLTVQAPFEGMIDLDDYAATFKEVDASKNTNAVEIIGNKQANVIRVGSVGSYMDGGIGADKLYGGDGADTFAYSIGGGADQIYNYNGGQGDIVQLFGDNSIAAADIKESGKNFVLTVGSGKTKGTITFNNPNGRITVVDEDGDTLTTFNEPPPDGITFDSKKTKMTVQAPFSGTVDLADYAATIKEVDASKNTNAVEIIGNKQANVIRAGSNGSLMDGGAGGDKLYGGNGADTYAYSTGGGADIVNNYSYEQGDVIKIDGTVKSSSISGKNVVLKIGSGSLTVNNVVDKFISINVNGETDVYKFNKSNATMEKAATNAASDFNSQFSTEDYWFEVEPNDATIDTSLEQIIEPKNMEVDALESLSTDVFKRSNNIFENTARKRQKR